MKIDDTIARINARCMTCGGYHPSDMLCIPYTITRASGYLPIDEEASKRIDKLMASKYTDEYTYIPPERNMNLFAQIADAVLTYGPGFVMAIVNIFDEKEYITREEATRRLEAAKAFAEKQDAADKKAVMDAIK